MYKPGTKAAGDDLKKMSTHIPAEIGTRGTVASLIMKEIEYFNRLESGKHSSQKSSSNVGEISSSGGQSRPIMVMANQTKKKRRGNRLPSICSMVDVSEKHTPIGISRFNYRNLKSDVKKLQT